jgi:hypothetical protein
MILYRDFIEPSLTLDVDIIYQGTIAAGIDGIK